jgi:hypothetical protein
VRSDAPAATGKFNTASSHFSEARTLTFPETRLSRPIRPGGASGMGAGTGAVASAFGIGAPDRGAAAVASAKTARIMTKTLIKKGRMA